MNNPKICVLTDNEFSREYTYRILNKRGLKVDFFCSPESSKNIFSDAEIKELNLKDENQLSKILDYDICFSSHSKQIFPKKLIENVLCINIHPGLNPYNRGWFPSVFSILNKKPAGVTIHLIDEKIDHGDIIVQEEIAIESHYTSKTLYKKIIELEEKLFEKVIDEILSLEFSKTKMQSEGNYNSKNDFENLKKIDLNKKVYMHEAIDFLRSMSHPPNRNAFFIDKNGEKVFVELSLFKDKKNT